MNPRTLKAEWKEMFEDEFLQDVSAVQTDLEDLIARLNRRSTKRGVGLFGASVAGINKPFDGAEVEVVEVSKTVFRITVKSERRGDAGYKFNVLDAGIPERSVGPTDPPMSFPIYQGNLTKTGDDSFVLNRSNVKVVKPVRWFRTRHVDGAPARKFYESILKRGAYKNRKRRAPKNAPPFWDLIDSRLGVTEFTIVED